MSEMDRKIRETRKRLRMTQGEFASALGVTQSSVSRWESGAQNPEFAVILKMADLAGFDPIKFASYDDEHKYINLGSSYGINVVGVISQGMWNESPNLEAGQQFSSDMPLIRDWDELKIEGFIIADDSAEPAFHKDSIVFTTTKAGLKLHKEDKVVITRRDDRGLYETTLKEIYVNGRGEIYAASVSPDPEHYEAFKIVDPKHDTTFETIIKLPPEAVRGLVIANFSIENPSRLKGLK